MKLKSYLILILILLSSCESWDEGKHRQFVSDSAKIADEKKVEKIISDSRIKIMFDTVGENNPIQVLNAEVAKREYSNYKDIRLTYKNISSKKIEGIKFKWYGLNAFGDPAEMGSSFALGFGNGFTDESIKPGKTKTDEWEILSKDVKKVVKAWAYEVVFEDGSKWKSSDN